MKRIGKFKRRTEIYEKVYFTYKEKKPAFAGFNYLGVTLEA